MATEFYLSNESGKNEKGELSFLLGTVLSSTQIESYPEKEPNQNYLAPMPFAENKWDNLRLKSLHF